VARVGSFVSPIGGEDDPSEHGRHAQERSGGNGRDPGVGALRGAEERRLARAQARGRDEQPDAVPLQNEPIESI